ncbi:hypothetical protein FNV43_RR20997 [Rhamnella rubrinervis]|uniref:AAA+ ATPase domain-containing protein n=1 Tax=Rhamnella rubrinervis TaxID=2594499 RepID=A0A8K0GUP7_9ROSA|nr:hypothetical protein FNV43_RR20997 [Rhamnella rubrinervis]
MDILASITSKVTELLVEAGRQLGYLICSEGKIMALTEETEMLKVKTAAIQLSMDEATTQLEVISPEVKRWVSEVYKIMNEVGKFLEEDVKVNKMCFNGWCPNLKLRHSLGRKAKKHTEDVLKLQQEGKFDRISYLAPPTRIHLVKSMNAFDSRTKILKQVMEAVRDENIHIIAICGMGGIGKTTMAKEVARRAQEEKRFGDVVMAVVSQNPNVTKIQGEIADTLRFKFRTETELRKADELREKIKGIGQILIVLDDIWERLNLEAIVIPSESEHTRYKILLTSQNEEVASTQMRMVAGSSINNHDLRPIAKQIAIECKGLPVAIVTVGRAPEEKGKEEWNDALLRLRKSIARNISVEVGANVYSKDHDIPIETLVRYGKGLSNKSGCVKLHDVVRDVAISIASKEHSFVVRCNNEIEEWPEIDSSKNCTTISVIVIQSLPSPLQVLQNMRTLSLEKCVLNDISSIGALVKLEILSLFGSIIQELPREIGNLQHLKLLDITECVPLEQIPPGVLSSLTKLEELYMFDGGDTKFMTECGIHLLLNKCERLKLKHMENLKNVTQLNEDGFSELLKVLNIRYYRDVENLINWTSKCTHQAAPFTLLEELKMKEMDNLRGFCHPDLLHLQRDPTTRFQLFYNLINLQLQQCNKVQYIFSTSIARGSIPQLQSLVVWRCNEIQGVFYKETEESDDSNIVAADMIVFPKLASVDFWRLRSLISLYRAMDDIDAKLVPFKCINWIPSLQSLNEEDHLHGNDHRYQCLGCLPVPTPVRKQKPYQGNVSTVQRSSHSDPQGEVRSAVARDDEVVLHHLETVDVGWCASNSSLLVIIDVAKEGEEEEEKQEENAIAFPHLRSIDLKGLGNLLCFCDQSNYAFGFPSLQSISIENCPKSETFARVATMSAKDTPMLEKVQVDYEEIFNPKEPGDLNTTIHQNFQLKQPVAISWLVLRSPRIKSFKVLLSIYEAIEDDGGTIIVLKPQCKFPINLQSQNLPILPEEMHGLELLALALPRQNARGIDCDGLLYDILWSPNGKNVLDEQYCEKFIKFEDAIKAFAFLNVFSAFLQSQQARTTSTLLEEALD